MISNPESLSKASLMEELRKRGISYPPNKPKEYYVSLYKQHFSRTRSTRQTRAEFSSDDEALSRPSNKTPPRDRRYTKVLNQEYYLRQLKPISDSELFKQLKAYKIDSGPVTGTTRSLYERKLAKAMAERAKGGVAESSSGVSIAAESDDEGDLSDRNEDTDHYELKQQERQQPQRTYSQVRQSSSVVKRVVQSSSSAGSTPYHLRSMPPSSSSLSSSSLTTAKQQIKKDRPTKPKYVPPPMDTTDADTVDEPWLPKWCTVWLWTQILLLVIAFVSGVIAFDYIRHGDSRIVTWINNKMAATADDN